MRVLVVAHRKEILEQIKETLEKYGLSERLEDGSIVVESIQRLSKGLMTEGKTLALGANAQDMTDEEASGIVADDSAAQLLSTGGVGDDSTAKLLSTGADDSEAQLPSTKAVAVVDSGTPKKERERINKEYREGKIRILVNCEIYGEGLDVKDVEMIQLARPTLSLNKYLQQVGRGLRPNKDGAQTIILDNVGMYYRFGLPHDERDWERMFLYGQTDDTQEMKQRISEQGNRERMQVDHNKSDVTDGHHLEMMTITNASEVQEALDLKYSKTEVFEYKGELGLRRGKTIVLIPMHKKIGPFVGGYAMVDGTFFVSEFGDTYTNVFSGRMPLILTRAFT